MELRLVGSEMCIRDRVLEAVLGGFWELCWKMLAPRWCFFEYLDRCCGILVPRWRVGAPRRGKIGELRRRGLLLGVGIHASGRHGPPCTPLRMDSPEWVSRLRLRLQLELDLEIWKTGRLEDWRTGFWAFDFTLYTQLCLRHGGGYIYIYCLLYTSPSPRDAIPSRMPSSA